MCSCVHVFMGACSGTKILIFFEKRESADQEIDPKLPYKNIFENVFFLFSEPS
jgi:hypothetical protein